MTFTYKYPRCALTVDCVVFGLDDRLKLLLIQRDKYPFEGMWALPGGFVEMDEPLEQAALRELREETGIGGVSLRQLHTFGAPDRDPRGRTVSVAYQAFTQVADHHVSAATDARSAVWFDVLRLPELAFDHDHIIETAVGRLELTLRHWPLGLELLPREFALQELKGIYEVILGRSLVSQKFARRLLATGLLVRLDKKRRAGPGRTARLYRFDRRKYRRLQKTGFNLEL